MFNTARIQLTVWYLLIIMTISILFSVAFYNIATHEINRVIHIQQLHQEQLRELIPFPNQTIPSTSIEDLEESENRLKLLLFLINFGILILSGTGGYFLAGRTLLPIKKMVDEQNRFISDSSHELRTPLTSVRTEIEVSLRNKNIKLQEAKEILASNLEEVKNMQALTDRMLSLSKFQASSASFEKVSLLECVKEAKRKIYPMAKTKSINIEQDISDITIHAQKQSIIELLVILLDNAIKYSHQKSKIQIKIKKVDKKAEITITDFGIGIAKEDLPHIFDRFFRAEKSRSKNEVSGYGLGLSIAKKIVSDHKGGINVTSIKDGRTAFKIALPIA